MSTDDLAEQIVARCRERLERGETVDPEAVIRAHPDMADALRAQFVALRLLERAFARDGASRVTDAPSLAGRSLGPFRLASRIGAGGMGTVYVATVEARSHGLDVGTRVAVKVIHPHLLAREGSFQRFVREAEIGGRVRHENVVRTLAADEVVDSSGTSRFLVMEYVEGRTLRELLADLTRVPEELCRHVGREIAKALAAIHAAGAVHRDVKPDNVIVTPDSVVKVMDLGVARVEGDALRVSQTGAFVGSVRYAAPEQFRSRDGGVDGRADLYALGLTLYELGTGKHPFDDDDFAVVMRRQMDDVPRPAGEVNPQLSPFFEELLRQLLEKDRDRRPKDAESVAGILEEGEESGWWRERQLAIRAATRRPLRRIRIPRETALYGRDAELAKLRELFDAAQAGDGQVVLVEGEAGIGKSRLVDEFVGRLAQAGEDVNFLHGSYPPGGAATASGAFTSAYREHIGDDEFALRAALPQTPLLVPAFAALLRGDVAPEGAENLTKDSLQTVFVHATRSFAGARPTIVLIDDLHFAPEEGRALFASLALAVPGHRILLVGAARPGLEEKWLAQIDRLDQATRLPLPRLGTKDLVRLLADSLQSAHVAQELAGRIGAKSDGNPFFVFEILRGLREGQFITKRSDGTWATTREILEIQVPSSIVDLVQARVSDLGPEERNALEVASCAGFEFDPALVGDVLRMERIPLLQRLGRIEKTHRLVRSAGRRFVFDHHQVMEVLYAGLSEPLREEYHAAIGTAIEARNGAASKDPKELDGALCVDLAEHSLKGAQGERAIRYLGAALDYLEKGYLNDAAIRLAERALAVPGLVTGRKRCELLLREADRLDLLGRRDAQRATLEEANAIAEAALRSRVLRSLGDLHWRLSRHAEARAVLGEALATARATGDRKEEAAATGSLGNVLFSSGRFAEAHEHHERFLALARELGDRRLEAAATGNLGLALGALGRFAEERQHHERCLVLARETGDRSSEARCMGNLGILFRSHGRLAEAREHHERNLALAREIGDRRGEAIALVNLGPVHLSLGEPARARRSFDESLALSREIDARYPEGYALAGLSGVADEVGDAAGAMLLAEEALALRREIEHGDGVAESLMVVADLRRRASETEPARAALDEALRLCREQGDAVRAAHALALAACLPGGDAAAAVAALAETGRDADSTGVRWLLWQATRAPVHLVEAKRLLDFLVEHAPSECRPTMLANVRLHREIAAAAREQRLPLAADASSAGDDRSAMSADA